MTPARTSSCALLVALAIAACAGPAQETPDPPPPPPGSPADTAKPAKPAKPAAPAAALKKPPRGGARGEVSSIALDEFFALQQSDKTLIYDARQAFFYHLGHIPGALNLPKANCDAAIAAQEEPIKAALADGKTIVVYCSGRTCADARTVAHHLADFGYPARVFSGGWNEWQQAALTRE